MAKVRQRKLTDEMVEEQSAVVERETRLLIAEGRRVAAQSLAELAGAEEASEIKRKACVDLLKIYDKPSGLGGVSAGSEAGVVSLSPAFEEAVHRAMEDAGRRSEPSEPSESSERSVPSAQGSRRSADSSKGGDG